MSKIAGLLIAAFALTACMSGETDVCTEASHHVAQCTGTAPAPSTCDPASAQLAQQVLGTPCAELSSPGGKSDGLSNPASAAICIALAIPLFVTDVQEDGLCCFSYNCQSGLTCRKHICRQPSPFGGPCDRNGHCEGDLVCLGDACGDPVEQGGACEPGNCVSGLVCSADGICGPRAGDGAVCNGDSQCEGVCIAGSCAPRSGQDGPCDADDSFDFELGLKCIAGACAPRSAKDGPCDPGDNFDCELGLKCVLGTCQDPPGTGGACDREDTFSCPMKQTCWEGTCEPRHAAGGPCERMFDCEFGLFCKDGTCGEL